jgi:TolB-like protein/tetratricopeptide (TPR) repeat protein
LSQTKIVLNLSEQYDSAARLSANAAMTNADVFEFGPFRLLLHRRELLLHGRPVSLGPRAFDLLTALVHRPGDLVTKDELLSEVWPGTAVEENNLHVQASAVRKALANGDPNGRYMMTVAGRGYRFVAPVTRLAEGAPLNGGLDLAADAVGPAAPGRPSIVVLPFNNLSTDPEQEYFADGIVEDLTMALSRFSSLFVIARNSAFTYKGRSVDVKQVGREMGVRYVLEGSVRKAKDRVRITGQLVEAENGTHVWADRYDGNLDDIFALQDQITASVVGALLPRLETAEIERARKKPTASLDAYDLYLRALAAFYSWTREGNDEALALLERSLQLDPRFAAAAVIADNCWAARYAQGWSPIDEAIAQSTRYITLAVQLDPDNAEALAVLARRTPSIKQDSEETIALVERAVASNPNSAFAWRCTGYALMFIGEAGRAVEHFQRTLRLSPRDPRAYDAVSGLAYAMVQLGREGEAIGLFRAAIRQNSEYAPAWRGLTSALALAGQGDEAERALNRIMDLDPNFSLQSITKRLGYSERVRAGRLFEGWRRAGVRERL